MRKISFAIFVVIFSLGGISNWVEGNDKFPNQSIKILLPDLSRKESQELEQSLFKRFQFIFNGKKLQYDISKRKIDIRNIPCFPGEDIKKYILSNFSLELTSVSLSKNHDEIKYISFINSSGEMEILPIKKSPTINNSDISDISYDENDSRLVFSLNKKGKIKMSTLINSINIGDRIFIKINDDLFFTPVVLSEIGDVFSVKINKNTAKLLISQFRFPISFLN